MKKMTVIGFIAFVLIISIACKNSHLPKSTNNKSHKYDFIEETNDYYNDSSDNPKHLRLVRTNGKIGFINENGVELFPCIFDSVVDVKNDEWSTLKEEKKTTKKGYFSSYAKVKKNGKWGLVGIDGKVAISCSYDEIYNFDYTKTNRMEGPYIDFVDPELQTAVVRKNGKWGLINIRGEILTECIYDEFYIPEVQLFYQHRAAAKKDGKWGFINEKGEPLSSFIYESVGSNQLGVPDCIGTFCGDMCIVKKNGKWGAIDLTCKEKIPFIYDYISSFDKDSTPAEKGRKWGYINKQGKEIIPIIYEEIKWFEIGLCPVKKNGLWGFLNKKGEVIIPTMYDDILVSQVVSVEGGLWFFSQDGYCAVKKRGKWGLIDKYNHIVVNFEFDGIKYTSSGLEDWRYFSDGFLAVQKGKFWSVINKNGLNHIPFKYDDVEIWSEGNVCIKKNSKWGLLDSIGRQLVPIVHANAMDAGNFNYKTNNK